MKAETAFGIAAASVLTAAVVGAKAGLSTRDAGTAVWYARLRKPSFTPPPPVFGLVWPVLEALQGYAGYRLLRQPPSAARSVAIGAWVGNLLGIASYTWAQFRNRSPSEGLAVTAGMAVSSITATAAAAETDRGAALATFPLAAWVLFATVLQEEVWRRNR